MTKRVAERLDKIISSRCNISRAMAREAIRGGRVTVDGAAVRSPEYKTEAGLCEIRLDGEAVNGEKFVYIMVNKPAGILSASRDSRQMTVIDLLPEKLRRQGLFPAGRLDKDSTGFVLVTNDGELAHNILSPKRHVDKVYLVGTDKSVATELAAEFAAGVTLEDGTVCKSASLEVIGEREARVVLREGKYHQIKRMFAMFGLHVQSLHRVAIGGVELDGTLGAGECRSLYTDEVDKLKKNS